MFLLQPYVHFDARNAACTSVSFKRSFYHTSFLASSSFASVANAPSTIPSTDTGVDRLAAVRSLDTNLFESRGGLTTQRTLRTSHFYTPDKLHLTASFRIKLPEEVVYPNAHWFQRNFCDYIARKLHGDVVGKSFERRLL